MTLQAGALCRKEEAEKGAELATHISSGVSLEHDSIEGEEAEKDVEFASRGGTRWVPAVNLEEVTVEEELSEDVLATSNSSPPSFGTPQQLHSMSQEDSDTQAKSSDERPHHEPPQSGQVVLPVGASHWRKLCHDGSHREPSTEGEGSPHAQEAAAARSSISGLSLIFEDEEILRATKVKSILHRGAAILQDSVGTEATYALSRPVDRIDVFISHNWLVPRRKKFLALALHFNLKYAMIASYVGVALGCLLNLLSAPPRWRNVDLDMRPHCQILGSLTFFLALFCGHDMPFVGRFGCRQRVFLDKVCIHQTDSELKAAGIRSLGAFLSRSDRMLVLLNSLYVQKLWTVYEMACFMYLHRPDELDLLPLDIARVTLQSTALLMTLQALTTVFTHIGSVLGFGSAVRAGAGGSISFVVMFPLTFILRAWALQRSDLFLSLRSFQIEKARCADESDRPLVSLNVCSFVRSMGLAHDDTSDADALQAFDRLVQERLPEQLKSVVGRIGVPYKCAALSGTATVFYAFDTISSQPSVTTSFALAWLLWAVNMQAVVIPSSFLICGWACNSCSRLQKWSELALKLGIAMLGYFGTLSLYLLSSFFRSKAEVDLWWVLFDALVLAVETLAIVKLF